ESPHRTDPPGDRMPSADVGLVNKPTPFRVICSAPHPNSQAMQRVPKWRVAIASGLLWGKGYGARVHRGGCHVVEAHRTGRRWGPPRGLGAISWFPMARRSVTVRQKKRAPPRAGKGKPIGLRLAPATLARVDRWAASQQDDPSRPEAIRRLVELALG